ncbi:MAG: DegV family protein [Lachnospiraceae bacterium]|nr:DegV family protein [Lachnospiraceae bacterium]
MSFKIVLDSCGELPEQYQHDERFQRVPLQLIVGDYQVADDENFNQTEFLQKVAATETCAKSACPSPESYMEAYRTKADHVYVVTLSSHLSGSYNSAVLAKNLYVEQYGEKDIYVCDSLSASVGETQIGFLAMKMEEQGLPFDEIVKKLEEYRDGMHTYFVLDNLETLRKNGRMSAVKAFVASTLNIKPVMGAIAGVIIQKGQAIGIKKALMKMADTALAEAIDTKNKPLFISHCNCPERAQMVKERMESKEEFAYVEILDTAGVSSMYANDGGVIVTL